LLFWLQLPLKKLLKLRAVPPISITNANSMLPEHCRLGSQPRHNKLGPMEDKYHGFDRQH
jgi:hypothetical protein